MIYEKGFVTKGIGSKLNLYERKLCYLTADAIICISESTKNDLLDVYPKLSSRCPIYVIHHGINLSTPWHASENNKFKPCNPYLLYVGGRDDYKNFSGAIEGYLLSGLWREGVKLICTGKKFNECELELFKSMGIEEAIVCEEHVSTERMYELYRNAYCLLYTSSYEGFGLPPIEAMSAGCPVIASNIPSVHEVVGNAGILINPFNFDSISNAILLLENYSFRNEIIDKGLKRSQLFTWDRAAEEHLRVYKEVSGL